MAIINALKPLLLNKRITIVWGSWCSDSKLHVPHFYQVLKEIGFPRSEVSLIGVDRDKKAESGSVEHLNIEKVPTFIVFDGDMELGRIVEQPTATLEEDLLQLLTPKAI